MAKAKQKTSVRIKVIRPFLNPITNRLAEIGDEMNVPEKMFWFKRLDQKDCELVKNTKVKKETKVEKTGSKK